MKTLISPSSRYYPWLVVFAGIFGVFASIGIGRFALGMLLPSMSSALGLNYSEMGIISTLNFTGYLVAALSSGFIARRSGTRMLVFIALLSVGISMSLISLTEGFMFTAVLYTITGLGSGASNVPIMGLVSQWFSRKKRGTAAGFIVTGSGLGVILSGLLVPYLNTINPQKGWRISWLWLGIFVIAIAILCYLIIRDRPGNNSLASSLLANKASNKSILKERLMYYIGLIYFLFGFTYVIYVTFFVTYLIKEWGITESTAGTLWAWIGVLSLLSGPVFGTLSDKIGRGKGLFVVFLCQSISYFLIATKINYSMIIYISILLFGLVAWSVPSIMAALMGDILGSEKAAAGFGFITFIFGLGQITGPSVAGFIAEKTGTLSTGFYLATLGASIAMVLSITLREKMICKA